MTPDDITVSVVSHAQNRLVNALLHDLSAAGALPVRIVVTLNVADGEPLAPPPGPAVEVVGNTAPKGFGANHNAAFRRCDSRFFCVINPDIRLAGDPFPPLLQVLASREIGVVGPLVRNPAGGIEDSARRFPTIASLGRKLFAPQAGPDYPTAGGPVPVDWIGGMFMLFRSEVFRAIGGFDERFFLYYEDVDLCRRLRARGLATLYHPGVSVIHDARRASRRNPRLMAIHAASVLRYLLRRYPSS
jgi:GT2 family glycosyltransferase